MGSTIRRRRNGVARAGEAIVAWHVQRGFIGVRVPDLSDPNRPTPAKSFAPQAETVELSALQYAGEQALVVLAEQASIERFEGRLTRDEGSRRVRRTQAHFSRVVQDDEVAHTATSYLYNRAETLVAFFWPAIELLAETISRQPELTEDEMSSAVDVACEGLHRARSCALAAEAVISQVLGSEVQSVDIDLGNTDIGEGKYGEIWTKKRESELLRRTLNMRRQRLSQAEDRVQQVLVLTQIRDIARRVDFGRATLADLSAAVWKFEQRCNQVAGPISGAIRAELSDLADNQAVVSWIGESAAQKSTGLQIPNRIAQLTALQQLAQTSSSPREMVKRMEGARDRVETFVDLYWPAITLVTTELQRHGELSGAQINALIADAMPDAQGLLA